MLSGMEKRLSVALSGPQLAFFQPFGIRRIAQTSPSDIQKMQQLCVFVLSARVTNQVSLEYPPLALQVKIFISIPFLLQFFFSFVNTMARILDYCA